MKAKINGHEVECTVEEFKQLTRKDETKKNEGNIGVTAVKWSKKARKYRKISKQRAKRIIWNEANIAKLKTLDAKYIGLKMPAYKRDYTIALELGSSVSAVSRQRSIQKLTTNKRG